MNGSQPEPSPRRIAELQPIPSLAKTLYQYGERWEIERVDCGAEWIAVLRETGGGYIQIVSARDLDGLRYKMDQAERDEPEEREADRHRTG